jgi:GTP 3',8-cyclase
MVVSKFRILRILSTNLCNHRCLFCHNEGQTTEKYAFARSESIRPIIHVAAQMGLEQIQFSGGEPLLNPEFKQLVEVALNEAPGVGIGMATNGSRLTLDLIRYLSPIMNNIRINLPSLNQERYAEVKKTHDLPQILEVISELHTYHAKVGLNVVYFNQEDQEIFDLLEFASRYQLDIKFLEWIALERQLDCRPIGHLQEFLGTIATERSELSRSAVAYTVHVGNGTVRTRVLRPACSTHNAESCREYGELRLLPTLHVQSCLLSDQHNLYVGHSTPVEIEKVLVRAANQLGCC